MTETGRVIEFVLEVSSMHSELRLPALLLCCVTIICVLSFDEFAYSDQHYKRTTSNYDIPNVTLFTQDGAKVNLKSYLTSEKPVMVDFVFTTCTTICPVLSACFSNIQRRLGTEGSNLHLVSISIDPDNDTPKKMKEYLKRYDVKPGWDFLTGSKNDIRKITTAFNAIVDDKMSHLSIIFLWSPAERKWVRLDGMISTSELVDEYHRALKN